MIPENYKTFFAPELFINNGVKDISFYENAFGASEQMRFSNDDGSIHVVELSIDGAIFHIHEITGKQYLHHGQNFRAYPFRVEDSGLKINHYCENKSYARRLEKMKSCLKNLHPTIADDAITAMAIQHPRVTLEPMGSDIFGHFEFNKTDVPVPEVFYKYKAEFDKVLGRS